MTKMGKAASQGGERQRLRAQHKRPAADNNQVDMQSWWCLFNKELEIWVSCELFLFLSIRKIIKLRVS